MRPRRHSGVGVLKFRAMRIHVDRDELHRDTVVEHEIHELLDQGNPFR
jgi:hypothetical protein